MRAITIIATCGPLLVSCSLLNTRPGHPDSYNTAYLHLEREWPTTVSNTKPGDVADKSGSQTPVYLTAQTPGEIWQARGYSYNMHLRYQAAAYKAEDVQDALAIPIFGLAVATVATAIGHASTVAVASVGLAGGSVAAGSSYLHPDKDATADQTASSALLCVVDQSKILNDMSAVPLTLDKAALQDALNKLQTDSGALMNSVNPADQTAKAAVQAVQTAADTAMQALDAAISQYVTLPSEIYQTADAIDQATKTVSPRVLDYSSVLKSLQTSATNQSTTDQAKSQVQTAGTTAAKASSTGAPSPAARKVTMPSLTPSSTTNLDTATAQVASATSATSIKTPKDPATAGVAGTPATGSGSKPQALSSVLNDTTIDDMTRVTILAKSALDDVPSPNFSAIAANIKGCSATK
jgi:hypothetical protein